MSSKPLEVFVNIEKTESDYDESIEPKLRIDSDLGLQSVLDIKFEPEEELEGQLQDCSMGISDVFYNNDYDEGEDEDEEEDDNNRVMIKQEDDVDCNHVKDAEVDTQDAAMDDQEIIEPDHDESPEPKVRICTDTMVGQRMLQVKLTRLPTSSLKLRTNINPSDVKGSPSTVKPILKNRTSEKLEIIEHMAGDIDTLNPSKDESKHILEDNVKTNITCDNKTKYNELLNEYPAKDRNSPIILTPLIYSCDFCKFTTNAMRSFKSHLKAHTATKQYICDICSYTTTAKYILLYHIRVHMGENPYVCKICNKKFVSNSKLNKHTKIHTGGKSFACNFCDKKFLRQGELSMHIRIHTGEKPFACNICNKKFTQHGHLKTHIQLHTGVKPYACNICEKKFTTGSHLNAHVSIHSDENPYACKICDRNFKRKICLRRHNIKMHNAINS